MRWFPGGDELMDAQVGQQGMLNGIRGVNGGGNGQVLFQYVVAHHHAQLGAGKHVRADEAAVLGQGIRNDPHGQVHLARSQGLQAGPVGIEGDKGNGIIPVPADGLQHLHMDAGVCPVCVNKLEGGQVLVKAYL